MNITNEKGEVIGKFELPYLLLKIYQDSGSIVLVQSSKKSLSEPDDFRLIVSKPNTKIEIENKEEKAYIQVFIKNRKEIKKNEME